MTDRQRWNWLAAWNAREAARRLNSMNSASVCDGTPFLMPPERQDLERHIAWLDMLLAELDAGARSRPEDRIQLITAGGTDTHRSATRPD